MVNSRRLILVVAAVVMCAAAAPRAAQRSGAPPAAATLAVAGDVPKPLALTTAEFDRLPRASVSVDVNGTPVKFDGALLGDVLKAAGVAFGHDPSAPGLASYVKASAPDGYEVVFSIGEIDPEISSSDILVADAVDGKPLAPDQGPFRIVVPRDKKGARGVHMLARLELVRLKKDR